jgi:hypothetical protein
MTRYHIPNTENQIKDFQRNLNRFTNKFLLDIAPLMVDGEIGPATKKRIRKVKYYLGLKRHKSSLITVPFLHRLDRPRSGRFLNEWELARGLKRRVRQRKEARKHRRSASKSTGVGYFDGRPVANWLIPYLEYARRNGWRGHVNSGWRDPAYSESLCYRMCGAPSCPGRCAGRNSNHAGSTKPQGAVDVSDYVTFGNLMRKCPYSPRIFNALGARDPVHFSASGR